MHVPTIITPTGSLIVEGKGNCVVEAIEHSHSALFAQQTILSQHHLGTFQIAAGKLFILEQVLEDASGVLAAIVLAEHILVGVVKNELGIEIAKEINAPMNEVSIGVCATREAVKNEK